MAARASLYVLLVLSVVAGCYAQLTCWQCNWKRNSAGQTIGGSEECIKGETIPNNASYLVTDKPWEGSCVACTKTEMYQEGELFDVQRSCWTEMYVNQNIGSPKTRCYNRKHYFGVYTFCICDDQQVCNGGEAPRSRLLLLLTLAGMAAIVAIFVR